MLSACNGEKSGEEMESAINLYMQAVPFVGDGFRQCVEENIAQQGIKMADDLTELTCTNDVSQSVDPIILKI